MTRTHGRSDKGARLVEKTPYGKWKATTFLGAIRATGFVAPLCVEGAINGRVFKAWVEQHLVRHLREGDVVVIFAMAADVPEVERLLQVSIDFF